MIVTYIVIALYFFFSGVEYGRLRSLEVIQRSVCLGFRISSLPLMLLFLSWNEIG